MKITEKMRDELVRTVEDPKNTTGYSHIPIAEYRTPKGRYLFAVFCQKKPLPLEKPVKP